MSSAAARTLYCIVFLNTLSGRRLRWLGHTIRMDHCRITHQALYWEVPGFKRGPGRPRINWRGMVKKDLRGMGLTWEEAEVAAQQTRMASECGPIRSRGRGMNQVKSIGGDHRSRDRYDSLWSVPRPDQFDPMQRPLMYARFVYV